MFVQSRRVAENGNFTCASFLFASKLLFSPTQANADMLTRRELPERASRQALNNVLIETVMPEKVFNHTTFC